MSCLYCNSNNILTSHIYFHLFKSFLANNNFKSHIKAVNNKSYPLKDDFNYTIIHNSTINSNNLNSKPNSLSDNYNNDINNNNSLNFIKQTTVLEILNKEFTINNKGMFNYVKESLMNNFKHLVNNNSNTNANDSNTHINNGNDYVIYITNSLFVDLKCFISFIKENNLAIEEGNSIDSYIMNIYYCFLYYFFLNNRISVLSFNNINRLFFSQEIECLSCNRYFNVSKIEGLCGKCGICYCE